ncbi:MAG: hypothetical protein NC308_10315, partial [Clostridium sp.]|nr:hypothetical protein [Clostridium sp.]
QGRSGAGSARTWMLQQSLPQKIQKSFSLLFKLIIPYNSACISIRRRNTVEPTNLYKKHEVTEYKIDFSPYIVVSLLTLHPVPEQGQGNQHVMVFLHMYTVPS